MLISLNDSNDSPTFDVDQMVRQLYQSHGEQGTYQVISKLLGYTEVPPTIEEFLTDSDWLGGDIGASIFPVWRAGLNEIYPNPFFSPYIECVCAGAIGTGKTTFAITGALYDLCRLLLMENPQEWFSLMNVTKISYLILNATLDMAENVVYDQMMQTLNSSKRFADWIASAKMASKSTSDRRYKMAGTTMFPRGIDINVGSTAGHALGTATIGCILDEMNFYKFTNQMDNYEQIKNRISSRFLQEAGGSCPARVWLISSRKKKRDQRSTDFLDNHIRKVYNSTDVRIFDYPIWEVLKDKHNYCGKTFKVFIGDNYKDPKVISSVSEILGLDEAKIIDVPIEYANNFEYDIYGSLADLAGKSVGSMYKFISSTERLSRCMIFPNPVHREVVRLDIQDRSDRLEDYFNVNKLVTTQHRGKPRSIHLDMGLTGDKLGIASSLIIGHTNVQRFDHVSGTQMSTVENVFLTEFVVYLEGNPEIPFYKLKEFFIFLRNFGYPISKITLDLRLLSANLQQDLKLLGFQAEYLSVDKSKNPYLLLKDVINENRWIGPDSKLLYAELTGLMDVGDKIDHERDGSKDGADAVAGSIFSANTVSSGYGMYNAIANSDTRNNRFEMII